MDRGRCRSWMLDSEEAGAAGRQRCCGWTCCGGSCGCQRAWRVRSGPPGLRAQLTPRRGEWLGESRSRPRVPGTSSGVAHRGMPEALEAWSGPMPESWPAICTGQEVPSSHVMGVRLLCLSTGIPQTSRQRDTRPYRPDSGAGSVAAYTALAGDMYTVPAVPAWFDSDNDTR